MAHSTKEKAALYNREYRKRNKDKRAAYNKKFLEDRTNYHKQYRERNPAKSMFLSARQRARKKSLPFDITEQDTIIPTHCPILGVELQLGAVGGSDNSPSLDRVKPELGYVKGNIIVISKKANMIKSNGSLADIIMVAKYLESLT